MTADKKRLLYFDTIKFFAIMWIFFTHFIARYHESWFDYWHEGVSGIFLSGISGKGATALLAVVLGYFAYAKASRGGKVSDMVIQRYAFFFVMGLVINIIYAVCGGLNLIDEKHSVMQVLVTSVKIDDAIFSTYWCMKSFFLGSVLSYINGRYRVSFFEIFCEIVLLYWVGEEWIGICLMGNFLFLLLQRKDLSVYRIFSNKYLAVLIFILAFCCIKTDLPMKYSLDGIASVLAIMVVGTHPTLMKLMDNRACAYLGRNCLGIYIMHPIIAQLIGGKLISAFGMLPYPAAFMIAFAICSGVVFIASIAAGKLIENGARWMSAVIIRIKDGLVNQWMTGTEGKF